MSTEQMRSDFEKMNPGGLAKWDNGSYVSEMVQSMWRAYQQAWVDSRAALVVVLPSTEGFSIYSKETAQIAIDGCVEFMLEAGITVRDE
ncbi:hypothetical protein AO825_08360 [Pectobacterium brasiliense]|uniref:hypothetical protein n=1 Tax=Pectobacterium brasiliense TaxID=180957 RepID=UPI0001A444DF|nr:hypothetical protein [Pectobacterium brasiliense]KGA24925.1 hypothetical protein KS44_06340 [Pectobacterium brasiliense]KRF62863.1 hypothetical protein AO825_08360 [Pectobacterium brasiliense]MBN3186070.1 hypothetical protein [Pectobacterium brasiliense]QHG26902.1 hypothetical protein GT391_01890 [Pectobacterium brasiliense]